MPSRQDTKLSVDGINSAEAESYESKEDPNPGQTDGSSRWEERLMFDSVSDD